VSIVEFIRPDSAYFGNVQCQSPRMGKSPILKTDYVIYLLSYVTGRHFTRGWLLLYQSPLVGFLLKHILGGGGGGGMILKGGPPLLEREESQNFGILFRNYFNF